MNLEVGEQLEFVGLQGMDDLGFEIVGGAALGDDVLSEDLHLFVGEVCVGKNVLYLYETFVQLLVTIPEMFADGEAAAEVEEREHRGGEVLAWFALLPVRSTGETENEGFDGGVALRLERGNQGVDALMRSRNHVLIRDDTEAVGCWSRKMTKKRGAGIFHSGTKNSGELRV